ncbi:DUF1801 domain-containing protein [Flavobacterium sp. CBA20B-1]|uniref:DUF1801 domain-containing protein n=1 Tax=unclassified Flavobacterium TaxID=196869 RepID=UPI0022241A88|nr:MULTISPECIES: DUF1801 domain-containing protein [unclassified Flavobacterium]WCM43258.1 DUF1801 domain-containing protein [Flavobacterium sp. CBA20B-1]
MNNPNTIQDYLEQVAPERQEAFHQLYETIKNNLPEGFEERFIYNNIGFVVPKSIFPAGYHCSPELPLPFISIASQKSHIALYHMGIYMQPAVYDWFVNEFPNHSKRKLDMGKSCIRFKKTDAIPFDLIAELMQKISVNDYIALYQSTLKK